MCGEVIKKTTLLKANVTGIVRDCSGLIEDMVQGAAMAGTFYGINKISAGIKAAPGFSE